MNVRLSCSYGDEKAMETLEEYPDVADNVRRILYETAEAEYKYRGTKGTVQLMAVTKTVPPEKVTAAVNAGVSLLGENRVQEYLAKKDAYPKDARVHFIGRLQTNKVKYIIDSVELIHSADSEKLCGEINRLAAARNITVPVLAEVNVGGEASKGGVAPERLKDFLSAISEMKNIRIRGLMTIPPPGESERCFEKTALLFEEVKKLYDTADILSMGMSGDYITAVKYGSTIIRVGRGIFGERR